ncbi:MAG TPA: DUF262 domain-containing protein [Candidatus Lachnoclostridium stercoravium]|uniref:DUF262 domain-containing protein n=1 Tax=Candidatus Lachnoclostridium stercoravium TaxID=2838633 RepID=A0A9D2KQX1_9FIRM|nr:DUF262 domain-containing protein [Candidatus Lachnoclostridium stercoravium]
MEKLVREEVGKLLSVGKENGGIRTTTIMQLLNDLREYSDEQYEEILNLIEEEKINLIVDSTEARTTFLDSSKISIVSKTLSVETIVKKLKYGEIDLDTDFQRKRSLWSDNVKSQLIESLMIQLPIPPMYFDARNTNKWQIIDGLQRLCTLNEFLIEKKWKLTGLEYLTDYNNCAMEDLPRIYQRRIEEGQLTFYLILPETPEEVKYSLFKRINTPGLRLEPQEIRHALFQGKATKLLQDLAESKEFCDATNNDVASSRMQDREMVLRYLALHYLGEEAYRNRSIDEYLNAAMVFFNKQTDEFIEDCKKLYFKSLACVYGIFGKYSFRRISKVRRNDLKPINTALFESWMNGVAQLSDDDRKILIEKKETVQNLYIDELDKKSSFYSDIGSGKYRSFVRRNETIQRIIREVLNENTEPAFEKF